MDEWKVVLAHFSHGMSNREVLGRDLTTSLEEVADLIGRERPDLSASPSQDGTITIMFTDIEGSTALNEVLGDAAYLPLLMKHNEIVEARTKEAGGTVLKSQGDGFMLVFPSARRSLECAVAIQRDVSNLDTALKVRMGLHNR